LNINYIWYNITKWPQNQSPYTD